MSDLALAAACQQVLASAECPADIAAFFDPGTSTVSYVVADPSTGTAAIIDPVLDYDPASAHVATASAERIAAHVVARGLDVAWLLETHAHADHLSAAPWLQARFGGEIAIGAAITAVQAEFGRLFHAEPGFTADGSQFDRLFADGDRFTIGALPVTVLHVPGHTPACVAYVAGDAAFVGDTLFMPDYGTARCDFPGGDAAVLHRSIRRLLGLPDVTRMFLCHDYLPEGRDRFMWETTVAAQRRENIHVHDGVSCADFVAMRTARDAGLPVPRLILPAVQVNMRAGHMPPAEANGAVYLKLPVNAL